MHTIKSVYLNGEFQNPLEARISVFDRGFIFGDGVYEVIPVYGGRPFRLPQHLQRLTQSLQAIGLRNPLTDDEWRTVLERLIRDNGAEDQSLYLQITRGVAKRDHSFPPDIAPTVFAYSQPMHYPEAKVVTAGVTAITIPDIRWQRCDIKATALLANVMLRQEAVMCGAAEAILLRDGLLTEGAASNIFIVKDGVLATPPKGAFILPGITRDLVVELAAANGIPCEERDITEAELRDADEVWLTSSAKEIMPIIRIDDQPVGSATAGPLQARLYGIYQAYKQAVREGKAS